MNNNPTNVDYLARVVAESEGLLEFFLLIRQLQLTAEQFVTLAGGFILFYENRNDPILSNGIRLIPVIDDQEFQEFVEKVRSYQ